MPTHIEQPDSPHSRPASRKMRSSPSSSAWRLTSDEPARPAPAPCCVRPGQHGGGGAQILDPRIGAGADEDAIDRDVGQLAAGRDAHVVERVAQIAGARPRPPRAPDPARWRRSAARPPGWCPR